MPAPRSPSCPPTRAAGTRRCAAPAELGGLAAMRPSIVFALIAVLAALGLGACGESKQDKAKSTVCDARADISKQVDQLKGLTVSTVTVDGVQNSLKAISSDLSKIKDAQGDLSGDRRQQVQDATKTFTSQVQSIAGSVGKSTSLSEAKAQLTSALQQLGDAYKQSFAKVDSLGGRRASRDPGSAVRRAGQLAARDAAAAPAAAGDLVDRRRGLDLGGGRAGARRRRSSSTGAAVRRRGADRGPQRAAAAGAGRAAPAVHARRRLPARPARRRAPAA